MAEQVNDYSSTRALIQELLGAMTEGKEVRAWLKQFGELERSKFAIIKIGGGTLLSEMPTLCSALSFLQKLGLSPIVIHGGGPQIDRALSASGIKTTRKDGLRVSDASVMPVISAALRETALHFVSSLNQAGVKAVFCNANTVQAELLNEQKYGMVGEPVSINTDFIAQIANQGMLPILSSIAEDKTGREVNVNADTLVTQIALKLQPQKILFLTPTGGILNQDKELISVIHLASEYEEINKEPWLQGGMKLKLSQINDLLHGLPLTASVAITRPDQLVKELFTHSGSGTLIRKGETIRIEKTLRSNDRLIISDLVQRSFKKTLRQDYWQGLDFRFAIRSSSDRAAAIVSTQNGALYLDKFAVLENARGEGLGAAVWRILMEQSPNLFWRSRFGNPINSFYASQAEGSLRKGHWQVFWKGDVDWDFLNMQTSHIAQLPDSFEE